MEMPCNCWGRGTGIMLCLYAAAVRGNEAKIVSYVKFFVTISRAKSPVKTASRGAGCGEKRAPEEWWRQYNDSIYFANTSNGHAQIALAPAGFTTRPMDDGLVFTAGDETGATMLWRALSENCRFGHGDAFFTMQPALQINL